MKFLILLFIITFSMPAFSGNWVAKSKWKSTLPADGATWTQALCESRHSELCFNKDDVGGDNLRFKPGFRAIDILKTVDCLNSADCQSMIDNQNFSCGGEVTTFDDKVNWLALDFVAESRLATGFFLWCEKEILVADQAGAQAADNADTQADADKLTRDNAKGPRETNLQACVQDSKNPTLSPQQIKDCIAALVREVLGSRVTPSDL